VDSVKSHDKGSFLSAKLQETHISLTNGVPLPVLSVDVFTTHPIPYYENIITAVRIYSLRTRPSTKFRIDTARKVNATEFNAAFSTYEHVVTIMNWYFEIEILTVAYCCEMG